MNLLIAGCLLATAVNLILTAVVFRQLGIYVMGTARGMDLSGIPIGRRLPDQTLQLIGGGEVALRQIGQPTLLYFGSPTCSECERTLPDLKPEFDRLAANGVAVFYLSFGDLRRTKMWAAKHSISTADLILVSQQLGHDLDVAGTPFMYALNNQGRIVDRGLLHTIARAQQFAERSTAAPELNLPL